MLKKIISPVFLEDLSYGDMRGKYSFHDDSIIAGEWVSGENPLITLLEEER